jgi:hypothetical protein
MTNFCFKPELPNVLHHLNFEVQPGEKVQQRYGRQPALLANFAERRLAY